MAQQQTSISLLVAGFMQARERFEEGRLERFANHPAYFALFEALAWTYSVDEWLREHGPEQARQLPELRGLRYARNAVHHRWDQALWMDLGGEFPLVLGQSQLGVVSEWRWNDELSRRLDADGAFYKSHLAGHPARETLTALATHLEPLT
jgi:hypothetical protein